MKSSMKRKTAVQKRAAARVKNNSTTTTNNNKSTKQSVSTKQKRPDLELTDIESEFGMTDNENEDDQKKIEKLQAKVKLLTRDLTKAKADKVILQAKATSINASLRKLTKAYEELKGRRKSITSILGGRL